LYFVCKLLLQILQGAVVAKLAVLWLEQVGSRRTGCGSSFQKLDLVGSGMECPHQIPVCGGVAIAPRRRDGKAKYYDVHVV
jgi:hypothetical protein